ncbi:MAG TPA: FAD-dependent thymidylate synthase [Nitrososphaera sp.]|nr:FAD-dependent thymidylate synthase [Nitrososphaera sp.]
MQIDVLDHGYVRLVAHMGEDLAVVNAARVSYDKESDSFSERDGKLLNFLAKNSHTSPFRHAAFTFELHAPMIVKNQWIKYMVGHDHEDLGAEVSFRDPLFAWNESSRRYITETPTFYHPAIKEWREAPANSKQGSGGFIDDPVKAAMLDATLKNITQACVEAYEWAMRQGVAPEQARLFLPAYALYIRWRWTASLQGILHFLDQRLAKDAQLEIALYAQAVESILRELFPNACNAWLGVRDVESVGSTVT